MLESAYSMTAASVSRMIRPHQARSGAVSSVGWTFPDAGTGYRAVYRYTRKRSSEHIAMRILRPYGVEVTIQPRRPACIL